MKVKITYRGRIKKPKVGDIYSGWGVGGRLGFSQSKIVEVHDDHIVLRTSAPFRTLEKPDVPDVIDHISMERYIHSELIDSVNKTTRVKTEVLK